MLLEEKRIRHGGMASPAEKGDIRPEADIIGPVRGRIGFRAVAHEAYGLAVYLQYSSARIQHGMGIDALITACSMAFDAEFPPVPIWAVPEQFLSARNVVIRMTGQTGQLSINERERIIILFLWRNENGMVVCPVLMAF